MSAYLGCELDFHEETVWQLPIFDSWEAVHDITFDTQNKWWRLTCDLTRKSVEHARGRYLVSGCLVSSISDVIANMFRHRPTLMAMIERPEMIKELRDKMLVWFKKMYDELYEIAAPYQYGYFDWLHLWAPGHICTLQSDISCMISPVMFSDLFIEEITEEAKYVDYSFYHLDGPDAIKHIDTLLEIEELDGIQWVPGAAASSDPVDWIDLFRHIQYAGKKFFIYSSPGCIKPILNAISRDRVYFSIRCSDEEEAQEVLLELGRIGC